MSEVSYTTHNSTPNTYKVELQVGAAPMVDIFIAESAFNVYHATCLYVDEYRSADTYAHCSLWYNYGWGWELISSFQGCGCYVYYIERYAPEGWVQAGYGEHLDAVCKVGQEISETHKCTTRVRRSQSKVGVAMYSHGEVVYDDRCSYEW